MSIRADAVLERFPKLLRFIGGSKSAVIHGPTSQMHPARGAIAFVSDESHLDNLLQSDVAAIVVHDKFAEAVAERAGDKAIMASKNPYLAMAQINAEFFPLSFVRQNHGDQKIHPTAVIAASAKLAPDVIIGPHVTIAENVVIGAGSFIGASCVIETHTSLGENCMIHPQVYIGHSCEIGDRVEIKPHTTLGGDGFGYAQDEKGDHHRISHYGKMIVEDDVHIGANVSIDRGTFEPSVIGAGTKIDNHCHFGHNIRIGKNCLVTAGFISAGSATIGDNCVFAGRASVNGHIEIVSGTTVGPLSAVTNSIKKPGMYAGFPVIEFKEFRKVQATLARLPRMRKQVARILKTLGIKDEAES